ncbi:MAG: DedA family protein [Janthinobacterium lividum]
MEPIKHFFDLLVHFNLNQLVQEYGHLLYLLFFLIIFIETGVVIFPFLPGDSLLFVAGALAAFGGLSLTVLIPLLVLAAFLGDNLNYFIGDRIGPRAFRGDFKLLKRKYLEQTQEFYAKHGGKTLILARFVPIVRTFAPFVAGVGTMTYRVFATYCLVGAVLWVVSMSVAGYLFGNIPVVQKNFELVVIGIVLLSIAPAVWQFVRSKLQKA